MADDVVDTNIITDAPDVTPADTDTSADKDTDDVKVLDTDTTGDDDDKSTDVDDKSTDKDKSSDDTDKDDTDSVDVASYALPEGTELGDDEKALLDGLFSKLGANSEQAQGFVDFLMEQAQAGQSGQEESHNQMLTTWANECRNDAEFGGDSFAKNQGIAKSAMDAFGTPEMKTILSESGYQANPEIFKFMVRVGKTLKEDDPGGQGDQSHTAKSKVDQLYPDDNNNKT